MPVSTVEFRVDEVLKGENVSGSLIINGYLKDKNDFNDRPVPSDTLYDVRHFAIIDAVSTTPQFSFSPMRRIRSFQRGSLLSEREIVPCPINARVPLCARKSFSS